MVRFITGKKGTGKTKKLIDMANSSAKSTDGHVVFIDDDTRHIYDLHYDIRFIDTGSLPLGNYREFIVFVSGILAGDHDITEIFVDGLTNIIGAVDGESLVKLVKKLDSMSAGNSVDFHISINWDASEFPQEISEYIAV